jgi:hypothetical protein
MSAQISTMTNSRSYELRPRISSFRTNYSTNKIANPEAHLDELSAPKDEDGKSPSKQGEAPPSTATAKIHSVQTITMKTILGTFLTTATSVLQIETSLPPTQLRLRNPHLHD